MVRSAAAVIVVILMAVAPTVRAICDAGCLRTTVTAHHGETSPPPSSHCATTDPSGQDAPAGDCGHDHDAPDHVLATAKPAVGPTGTLAILVDALPVSVVGLDPLRLTSLSRVRPPVPPPTRPRPLRI